MSLSQYINIIRISNTNKYTFDTYLQPNVEKMISCCAECKPHKISIFYKRCAGVPRFPQNHLNLEDDFCPFFVPVQRGMPRIPHKSQLSHGVVENGPFFVTAPQVSPQFCNTLHTAHFYVRLPPRVSPEDGELRRERDEERDRHQHTDHQN